jgi:hypothetical protein
VEGGALPQGKEPEPISDPVSHYAPELNLLERRARDFLQARDYGAARTPLTQADLAALRTIRNRAVMLAALSGTISGIVIGGTEVYLRLVVLNGDETRSMLDDPWLWAAFYAGVGVLTVIEIVFLYWNALRAITRIGGIIGVSMKSGSGSNLVATGLARSALEMPNPQTEIYGIDPYALMPRWRLLIQNLLYKLKVGATSFVLRILLRRIFARAVLRGYIPLLAIPLYAIWNAVITWRVMREARLRALAPFAVDQIVRRIETALPAPSHDVRRTLLHGAGEIVRRGSDAHPSYVLLLSRLLDVLGFEEEEIDVDWERSRREFQALPQDARRQIAGILAMCALVAGRPRSAQRKIVAELHELAQLEPPAKSLAQMHGRMIDGQPFAPGDDGNPARLHGSGTSVIDPPPA